MNPQDFIAVVAPVAVQLRREGAPIFPSVRIAQAANETGWTLHEWNNLVGYKVGSGVTNAYWQGAYVNKGTWEVYDGTRTDVTAAFRAYASIADCFCDQDLLFTGWDNYAPICAAKTPEEQCYAFTQTTYKYATDPQYSVKLLRLIDSYGLKAFDEQAAAGGGGSSGEEDYTMQAADANKVILFLKAAYECTDVQEARDEFHRLANELRKASGQAEE